MTMQPSKSKFKPRIGISMGDPSGIGAEILNAALANQQVKKSLTPIVFGDGPSLRVLPSFKNFSQQTPNGLAAASLNCGPTLCAVSSLSQADRRLGKPSKAGGRAQLEYIHAAIRVAQAGGVDGLCTAPVSKEQISRAGMRFVGHTELLAESFQCNVLMLMEGPRLRVALATNHLPLAEVSAALKVPRLVQQLLLLSRELRLSLGHLPHIAVCGVNPHAGEGGLLGTEERRIIIPALRRAKKLGVNCEGPFPADGLFAKIKKGIGFDVVLAMFHDQGLIATKATDFERTVNVTLGLPIPRTSPDHGVAYDIAGKGLASAVPMIESLLKVAERVQSRRRFSF